VPWLLVVDAERLHAVSSLGCNDFVVRGFDARELQGRVQRLAGTRAAPPSQLRSGTLVLDLATHTVRAADVPVKLTPQQFALLRHLLRQSGRPQSREQLLHAVWGDDYRGGMRTVDLHVRRLRAALGPAASPLQTLRHCGYIWTTE
jgi:two-component system phosphate regulon response regulator PhoB